MNNIKENYLINGNFTPAEAREIIVDLYQTKIQFHELKNFSSVIQSGHKNEQSESRIASLRAGLQKVLQQIDLAENEGRTLIIQSTVEVQLANHEPELTK